MLCTLCLRLLRLLTYMIRNDTMRDLFIKVHANNVYVASAVDTIFYGVYLCMQAISCVPLVFRQIVKILEIPAGGELQLLWPRTATGALQTRKQEQLSRAVKAASSLLQDCTSHEKHHVRLLMKSCGRNGLGQPHDSLSQLPCYCLRSLCLDCRCREVICWGKW